jgi:hypothetical protein
LPFQGQERAIAFPEEVRFLAQAEEEGFEPADALGDVMTGNGQLLVRAAGTAAR